jgi:hypothetical protein
MVRKSGQFEQAVSPGSLLKITEANIRGLSSLVQVFGVRALKETCE